MQLKVNNRLINVSSQATLLQACEAAGVDVSRFCYHEKLSVAGNCRRCLVEVQKSPKPVVACARPVIKGRVVFIDIPLVRKARESVLEFLLVNHPLDCPICDQGGECDLQDEVLIYGSDRGRYFEFKRSVEDKECGPIVKTIRTRCIHCIRCIRFSTEVAGNEVRGAFGRGEEREIGIYVHSFLKIELSGNLVDLCPVGALISKPYAFQARSWELQRKGRDILDFFDGLASDIVVHIDINNSQEEIIRILPRVNGYYTENWISDRIRYAFDGLNYGRIKKPIIFDSKGRIANSSWVDILKSISKWIYISISLFFVVGSQINLERVYSLVSFVKITGSNNISQGYNGASLELDLPFFYSLNRSISSFSISANSGNTINSDIDALSGIIRVGINLRYEASLLNIRLRREQNRYGLSFIAIGAFNSLRYAHTHQGNSFRAIIASLENRSFYVKNRLTSAYPVALLLGINSLRGYYPFFLQQLIKCLGKLFFVKIGQKQKDRLGYIHSSLGSLAFAHLGVSSNKNYWGSEFEEKSSLFNVNQPSNSTSFYNWIIKSKGKVQSKFSHLVAFDIHFDSAPFFKKFDKKAINVVGSGIVQVLPVISFYERIGHIVSLENRRRKHSKVVSTIVEAKSLEIILSAICAKLGALVFFWWADALSRFEDDCPRNNLLETIIVSFNYNPFALKVFTSNSSKLVLFSQIVQDFYLQEPIAAQSHIRAECSLFLGEISNFISEVYNDSSTNMTKNKG